MVRCEVCGNREACVGCLMCRRNLCERCFDDHMGRIAADMDEGFIGMGQVEREGDSPIVCEHCGLTVESARMDEHLFEIHGIMG